jgi:iron complex outermembrane receptor protein
VKPLYLLSVGMIVTTPAWAQSDPSTRQDDIVITAERTNQTLASTATSVQVLTADEASRRAGDASTYDLIERIPNVVATRSSNLAPAVRGVDGTGPAIGGNAFFAGTRPRLNFLVDGRTLTFNEATYVDGGIWDMQQLEVYRGPQSLLQGRNSIAGVIAIKTADPSFDWHGRARAAIGSYDFQQYGLAIGGPLIGQSLAFRVAGEFRRDNTFIHVNPAIAAFDDPRRSQSKTLRAKLLLTPEGAPGFRSLLTLSYTDAYAPQSTGVMQPYGKLIYSNPTQYPRFRTRASVAISDTSWQIADGIALSAFLTATDFRINRYVQPKQGIAQIDGVEYTAEPRLRFGGTDGTVSGFVAAYIFRTHQREFIDFLGDRRFYDKTDTNAAFGELNWKPSSFVEISGGARYEEERRDRTGGAAPFTIDYHKTFRAFLPHVTVTLHPGSELAFGATVSRGYNAGGAGFAFNPPFPSFTYDKEMVWDYEGFVRATTGKLRLSANVFYNDYSGLQLPFDVANNPSAPALVIRNADRATTYGAEAQASFAALKDLDLTASAGLLKTRIDRFGDPNVQGNALPRSPAFSFTTGIVGRPFARLEASFDLRYSDAYYSDAFNTARGKTDPYFVGNAQVSYRVGPARLFVGATNIFNSFQPGYDVPGAAPSQDIAYLLPPRRVTGGIDLSF